MQDIMEEFILESVEKLDFLQSDLLNFEKNPDDLSRIDHMFRIFHTIKGTAGFLDMPRQVYLAGGVENLLESAKKGEILEISHFVSALLKAIDYIKNLFLQTKNEGHEPIGDDSQVLLGIKRVYEAKTCMPSEEPLSGHIDYLEKPQAKTFRVQVDLIEKISEVVGELVLAKNKVLKICQEVGDSKLLNSVEFISKLTLDLQETISKTRLQPISHILSGFPRLVRDLSIELDKKIHLSMEGTQTELDRQILEGIKEPLTHIIRNSADHGIERPQERINQGKSETGHITIKAYHDHEYVKIEIGDDGNGIDIQKVKNKAILMGLMSENQEASQKDIENVMFMPGFSTSSNVTNVSGRGVGLDIVKMEVERVGGSVHMKNSPLQGLTFILNFPLTIVIIPALIVQIGEMGFAVPQSKIMQIIKVDLNHDIVYIDQTPFLNINQDLVPLACLSQALGLPRNIENTQKYVVTVPVEERVFGVIIDGIKEPEEIIVKRAPLIFKHIPLFAGSSILKDESVVMILDLTKLEPKLKTIHSPEKYVQEKQETKMLVMFETDDAMPWIVELSHVYRIEEFDFSNVVLDQKMTLIKYQGGLLLLHSLLNKKFVPVSGIHPVLILKNQDKMTGLIICDLLDIFDAAVSIDFSFGTPESLGDAIVNSDVMKVLNCDHFFNHAYFKKEVLP